MSTIYLKLFFAILLAAGFTLGCGPSKAQKEQKQQEDLAKEVLEIHDEVMPEMETISKYRRQIKEKLNIWTADVTVDHSAKIAEATAVINELETADKNMMDWMHTYNGGQGLYDHTAIISYLETEKVKITDVKSQTDLALESAKKFLDNNK